MKELKPRITENGIEYVLVGDYYIPDLKLPEENRPIGKYGQWKLQIILLIQRQRCVRRRRNSGLVRALYIRTALTVSVSSIRDWHVK